LNCSVTVQHAGPEAIASGHSPSLQAPGSPRGFPTITGSPEESGRLLIQLNIHMKTRIRMLKSMRLLLFAGLLIIFLFTAGCTGQSGSKADKTTSGTTPAADRKLIVITTIYPLYDFAANAGKDRVELINLVPAGAEPHEWEPSPKDLAELSHADVFIYCGAGLESWTGKALEAINAKNLIVVDASQNIPLLSGSGGEPETAHDPSRTDPHVWVDPNNARQMVENITAGLIEADPAHQEDYRRNTAGYQSKLEALDQKYQRELAGAKLREFITSHDAFGYLASRYNLVQVPIRGLSPEAEPTPAKMAEVIREARTKNIKYIFFESLVSPKVSEVIAAEIGAATLVLNDAAGLTPEEMKSGRDYIAVMEENLENLKKALEVSQ